MFGSKLPHKLMSLSYSCGGGPMHMIAFGRTYATCIDKKSPVVTHKIPRASRVAKKSHDYDEYEEDSFCDMSEHSDDEEPQPKKMKLSEPIDIRALGRAYRV